MSKLTLVSLVEQVNGVSPAVMYEKEAARYLKLSINTFRALVHQGLIPFTKHIGGKRRIYLKADLDDFLNRLPRYTICSVEDSPKSTHGRRKK